MHDCTGVASDASAAIFRAAEEAARRLRLRTPPARARTVKSSVPKVVTMSALRMKV
jgi:hypothetical protein